MSSGTLRAYRISPSSKIGNPLVEPYLEASLIEGVCAQVLNRYRVHKRGPDTRNDL